MVPKIHAKGTSFMAATRYVMHDKQADTAVRVEWSETVNLGTNNPGAAARVMAATAMDSARLKKEAGVRNTGRKSNQHVFHATLSWHADEAENLTKEHKLAAAKWFLKKLGADDRQALIVSHNDEPQPHVHILVNRVSSQDGRMLSSSMEKLRASKWAEKYEKDRGKIYCDQRVLNNQSRKRGEYVRGQKDEARHFQEMRKQAGSDKKLLAVVASEVQKMKKAYHQKKEDQRKGKTTLHQMDGRYRESMLQMREGVKKAITKTRQEVQNQFRSEWEQEYHEQKAQLSAFALREKDFLGRVKNKLSSVDFGRLVGEKTTPDGRAGTISKAFGALGDSGIRLEILKKQQAYREQEIKRRQNRAELQAVQSCKRAEVTRMWDASCLYRDQRQKVSNQFGTIDLQHDKRVKAISRDRYQKWKQVLAKIQERTARLETKRPTDRKTASLSDASRYRRPANDTSTDGEGVAIKGPRADSQAKASDLLPKEGSAGAAKKVDMYKKIARQAAERDKRTNPDRGDDDRDR